MTSEFPAGTVNQRLVVTVLDFDALGDVKFDGSKVGLKVPQSKRIRCKSAEFLQ